MKLLNLHLLIIVSIISLAAQAQIHQTMLLGTSNGLSNVYINDIAQDKRGHIWVATEYGLNIFNGQQFIPIYKPVDKNIEGLCGNELNSLLDDPNNDIMWVGSQREGLNAFNYGSGTITTFRHDDKVQSSIATNDVV